MLNEANAVYTHHSLVNLVAGVLGREAIPYAIELTLPNRKIADLAYFDPDGYLHIIECKIDFRPVHLAEANNNYGRFCNRLWIAVQSNYPMPAVLTAQTSLFSTVYDQIGVMTVSHQQHAYYRVAQERHPTPLDIAGAGALLASRLTTGERPSALKPATGAERPENDNGGSKNRRCQV